MGNHVHNHLTVVKGKAEEVLKFIREQEGVFLPSICNTKLCPNFHIPEGASIQEAMNSLKEQIERLNVSNASPSVEFDSSRILSPDQVQDLLEKFPGHEIIHHFSEVDGELF